MIAVIFIISLLIIWLICSQWVLTLRIPDKKAKVLFSNAGVPLTIETIKVNGEPLHYAKTGDDNKPTLLFVHGSPGNWIKFQHYMTDKELLEKYRMVAVDRPGFGYSGFGNARNLSEQSIIISSLLKILGNGKPIFAAGPSLGGPLVIRLAADNPGLFSGLVLLAAAVDPLAERKERWRKLFLHFPFQYLLPGAWRASNKEIWLLKKDLVELANVFSSIECPVYILHGDKDVHVPISNIDYAKKMLTHSKHVSVTVIPGANHFIVGSQFPLIREVLLKLH